MGYADTLLHIMHTNKTQTEDVRVFTGNFVLLATTCTATSDFSVHGMGSLLDLTIVLAS